MQVAFVFGNGEDRAVFALPETMTPDDDGVYRGICDLSEFPARAELGYIGVIIYSERVAQFDLASVKVYSDTLDDEEIAELVSRSGEEAQKREIPMIRITIAAFVLVLVVIVTVRAFGYVRHKDKTTESITKRTLMEKSRRG